MHEILQSLAIQMKAGERFFPVALFIMPYKVILTFQSADTCKILQLLTIQMGSGQQYFPVVLLIILFKVVLTFESVDEILKCDHSNESY